MNDAPDRSASTDTAIASGTVARGWLRGRTLHHALPVAAGLAMSVGVAFRGFNDAEGRAWAPIAAGLLLIFLLALTPPRLERWRRAAPVWLAVGAALLWSLGTWAAGASLTPDLFAPYWLGAIGGALALMAGWIVGLRPSQFTPTVVTLAACNALLLLTGLILRGMSSVSVYDYWALSWHGRFAGTMGNSNTTAALAGAMAVIAVAQIGHLFATARRRIEPRRGIVMVGWALILLIAMAAQLATVSRFALVVTVAAIGFVVWRSQPQRFVPRRAMKPLGIGLLVLLALLFATSDLSIRFAQLDDEMGARVRMWTHFTSVAFDSPLTGYGAGSFAEMNMATLTDPVMANAMWPIRSAHNIALQLMLVGGLPYLALMSAAALLLVRRMRHARRSIDRLGIACAVGIVVAVAMIDIALDVPAAIMLTLFLAGLLWGDAEAHLGKPATRPAHRTDQKKRSPTRIVSPGMMRSSGVTA